MQRIIESASGPASHPAEGTDRSEGWSLAEIREIAREVGIDPVRVDRAAASLDLDTPIDPRVAFGTFQSERRFGRALGADEMRFVIEEADRYFGVEGTIRQATDYTEWYSPKVGAFVGIVNEGGGSRVRVILDRAAHFIGGGLALGFLGLVPALGVATGIPGWPGVLGGAGIAVATAGLVVGFWRWRRSGILQRARDLLDLMSEAARLL